MTEGSAVPELRSFPANGGAMYCGEMGIPSARRLSELPRGLWRYTCVSAQSAPLAVS